MLTAKRAANAWMQAHTSTEWQELLEDYEREPFLPEEVAMWLRTALPEVSHDFLEMEKAIQETPGLDGAKTWTRFEEGFIANVSAELEAI
jgi:hypothetical protein